MQAPATILCLLAAGASLRAAGEAPAGAPPDPDRPCEACSGSGLLTCRVCSGRGTLTLPCNVCGETGTVRCPQPECQRSWKPVKCPVCRDTRTVVCQRCKGAKKFSSPCYGCAAKGEKKSGSTPGSVRCKRCGGSGRVADTSARPPPIPDGTLAAMKEGLEGARAAIERAERKLTDLAGEADRAIRARAGLEKEIEEASIVPPEGSAPEASSPEGAARLRSLAAALAKDRGALETAHRELEEARAAARAAQAGADTRREAIDSLGEAIRRNSPGEKDRLQSRLREQEAVAAEITRIADGLQGKLAAFGEERESLRASLRRWEGARRVEDRKAEAERSSQAKLKEAFGRVKGALPELADRAGLPRLVCELSGARTSGAEALELDLAYLDDEAELASAPGASLPGERRLRALPGLVRALFAEHPAVQSMMLEIRGVPAAPSSKAEVEPRRIQSFYFRRGRLWEEPAPEGEDSWKRLLTESSPRPPYPRELPPRPSHLAVILVVGFSVFLGVLLVVLLKFMGR